MENNKRNKKGIILFSFLVAMVVLVGILFMVFRPKTTVGSKHITIEVTNKDQQTTKYDVYTDAEFLREAMDDTDGLTYSGTDSGYGLFVDTINGETADYSIDSSYWAAYVNGEYGQYGVDSQPVTDGDVFGFVYTIYTE